MTDSDGHLVDLASLVSKGPLVISFNRGPWCDYCGLELHALARAYPEIFALGGEVVSIVPETAKYARALQQTRGLPFRVLTDLFWRMRSRSAWSSGWATKSSRPTANSASILNNFKVMAGGCCPSPRRW